jgi:hypothetical protein
MSLDVRERHAFVGMLAQRIEAENQAVAERLDRLGRRR